MGIKGDVAGLNKSEDEVKINISPRTTLIVQQRVFDCFNTKDQSKIYHATNFTRLEEP